MLKGSLELKLSSDNKQRNDSLSSSESENSSYRHVRYNNKKKNARRNSGWKKRRAERKKNFTQNRIKLKSQK